MSRHRTGSAANGGSRVMSIQNWLCRIRARFIESLRRRQATLRQPRAKGHAPRGAVTLMTCGCVTLVSTCQNQATDRLRDDPCVSNVTPIMDSDIYEPTTLDESVPVRLLLETPNIRLFEIGIDQKSRCANYGWFETEAGSWAAGGEVDNHRPGSKSLWVTLSKRQSLSLKTENGWLNVAMDVHATEICPAREVEYLRVLGGHHTIDMTGLDQEMLSANLIIDLNDGVVSGALLGRSDADCLIVSDEIDNQDVADGNENAILNSLFCDVAFIDSANLGGRDDVDGAEKGVFLIADESDAWDETHSVLRHTKSARPRIRPGMEMNL